MKGSPRYTVGGEKGLYPKEGGGAPLTESESVSQSCPTLCDPVDYSLPGSSIHGIFQARILEWVAVSSSRGSSHIAIKPASLMSPVLAGRFFTTRATWEGRFIMATLFKNKLPQSFPGDSVVKNLAAV